MTLVGKPLINFTAAAVLPDNSIDNVFDLTKSLDGRMAVLFFYPLDFTFVCPSEILALHEKIAEFTKRQAHVIAISVDSQFTHLAYRKTPVNQGGIGEVAFPMVADLDKTIARSYGVLQGEAVALRAVFVADKNGIIRHELVNDLPFGRNIDEIIRILDAIDHHDRHGEVCPANWQQGKRAMTATPDGVKSYLSEQAGASANQQ